MVEPVEGTNDEHGPQRTKDETVEEGRDLARAFRSEHINKGLNGRIQGAAPTVTTRGTFRARPPTRVLRHATCGQMARSARYLRHKVRYARVAGAAAGEPLGVSR